jgi:diacylglycerol kinase family enzyme
MNPLNTQLYEVKKGYKIVIAMGGDGTIGEVI